MTTLCSECQGTLTLSDPTQGDIIPCPDCGAELQVISVEPPELALAPEVDEDWGQ